ncbi:MAG: UvrB/UvrC motif-containing protein [Oscillibacter sp.]|nr:UvrB/UvrC motif-containing protein [Oscillibacter sp.]
MKCEHCGKNEVSFVYRSNINGKVEEKHLCSECAEKLGYTQKVAAQSRSMMQDFFGNSFFGGGLLNDFFSPMPSLMGRLWEDPFEDFFTRMPALGAAPAEQKQEEKKEDLVDEAEQGRFARMRKLNALKLELRKAVHKQEFERAAQLRDEIRGLEKEGNGEA